MRGTLSRHRNHLRTPRIIPAHAGSTPKVALRSHYDGDHPRARGEHSDADLLECLRPGSSPRMRGTNEFYPRSVFQVGSSPRTRGTLDHAFAFLGVGGIIPAHAGNTVRRLGGPSMLGDHPRACGEHTAIFACFRNVLGSSPRMRGTHASFVFYADCRGIIPAHAGNTSTNSPSRPSCRDHPRACGEHHSHISVSLFL